MTRRHEFQRYTVGPVRSWRTSRAVALVAIVLFGALHVAVPVSRIGVHDSARRFGWQMFSTAREAPAFVVVTEAGELPVELGDYMAGPRGDVDIVGRLPPHLCNVVPGALRVTWGSGEHQC